MEAAASIRYVSVPRILFFNVRPSPETFSDRRQHWMVENRFNSDFDSRDTVFFNNEIADLLPQSQLHV